MPQQPARPTRIAALLAGYGAGTPEPHALTHGPAVSHPCGHGERIGTT